MHVQFLFCYSVVLFVGLCCVGVYASSGGERVLPRSEVMVSSRTPNDTKQKLLPPVLSTCPLHTNRREAHIYWSMVTCPQAALVRNYLDVYWPCAGGLSAVNTIGTRLCDPINSGLTQWCMAVSSK